MEKRKRIIQIVGLVACMSLLLVSVMGLEHNVPAVIPEESTPLSESVGTLLTQGEADITVIPDKYNTGAQGELTKVTSDCYISGVKFGTTGVSDRKLDLYYQSVEVPDTILVENYDFSSSDFKVYNVAKVKKSVTVIYRNCRFQSYTISGSGTVKHIFEDCTFTHFAGSDASFANCYFGSGTDGDGINPGKNCTFENCMIADLIQPASVAGDKHIDGFQIFGSTDGADNTNIHLFNCRFEVPAVQYTLPSGALNCPVSIIMRYSDADNITFDNCYVNGGYYYALMLRTNDNSVTNLTIRNMRLGETSKNTYDCDSSFSELVSQNVEISDSLYIASVRRLSDGIHLSVTNDTNETRELSIVTKSGVEKITIDACPKGMELVKDSMNYSDFPFDIDVVIPITDWVACFDTTSAVKQIRYVNWTSSEVYADLSGLIPEKEEVGEQEFSNVLNGSLIPDKMTEGLLNNAGSVPTYDDSVVMVAGMCGDDVSYYLQDGILVLSGSGATYNYHSGKTAPWYEERTAITEIHVEEGITALGNQLFVDCTNLKGVIFSEGVETIGSNVFKRCNQLVHVCLPKTLKSIGSRSFTSAIQSVDYGGTEELWATIDFGSYNTALLEADIYYAESILGFGFCGDSVEWELTSSGVLTLAGEGATYNYHSGNTAPWYEYADLVNEVIIEEGISVLGNYLFRNCTNIVSVDIPISVTSVGINSFSRCKSLSEMTCSSSLTQIGKNAFAGTALTVVNFTGTPEEWKAISGNVLDNVSVVYR